MKNTEIKLSSEHNSLIDVYRLIFICMVMLHHARYVPNAENIPFEGGYICVEYFFILSGYLLAKSACGGGRETDEKSIARDTVHEIWKRIINLGCYLFPAYLGNFILRHLIYLNKEGIKIIFRDSVLSIFELMFLSLSGINHSVSKWHGVTWYVSAMFIAIFVIYPLLRKYKYFYPYVIAPLISLFIYGWLSVNYGWIGAPMEWTGIAYVGLLGSFAGLSMGVICFHAVRQVPINKKLEVMSSFHF